MGQSAVQPSTRERPFRLGVVGAGRMGRTHLVALSSSPGIDIVGVSEPNDLVRRQLRLQGLTTHADLEALLAEGRPEGVLIAAPTDRHLEVVREVVGSKIPVLCEKPCGVNLDEAEACAKAARDAGVVLQVAYWRRYVPELHALRERMAGGELGQVLTVHCQQWDMCPPGAEFRARSGGIFVDMGVHEFDQARWLTGQEFGPVLSVVTSPPVDAGVAGDADCGHLVSTMSGGSTAVVSLGRWHPAGDSCKVDVYGTSGTESCWFLPPSGGEAVFHDALRRQAEDFARWVRHGRGIGATVDDAVRTLEVAARASAAINARDAT
jgi:myo-inositol 2-dehydrogenase/D-chiro-inositol 1-dehydrogenase